MGGSVTLSSFRATLLRTPKTFSLHILPQTPKILSPPSYHNRVVYASTSSSAAAVPLAHETTPSSLSPAQHRPWPEWVTFVDRLKSRGYLVYNPTSVVDKDDPHLVYKDMRVLKDACLSFARDRFDVFKSLSKDDVQALVESGCPTITRKVVNSAKRLRLYTGLNEADVCSLCDLQESCDRAYVILQESESAARTVDIVRILLFYALEQPVGIKPAAREQAELSAKRLLSELIELSEQPLESGLARLPGNESYKKQRSGNISVNKVPKIVDKDREDWTCTKCNFLNFSRNVRCLKCSEPGPSKNDSHEAEMKTGDWICPECNFMNFSRNIKCLKCKADGPKRVDTNNAAMKKGDWNCPQCGFMNFAGNSKCFRCTELRPPRQLKPGEWECPSCDFLNFRRNVVCRKCQRECPKEKAQTLQYE